MGVEISAAAWAAIAAGTTAAASVASLAMQKTPKASVNGVDTKASGDVEVDQTMDAKKKLAFRESLLGSGGAGGYVLSSSSTGMRSTLLGN